jgi:hypothetical protein
MTDYPPRFALANDRLSDVRHALSADRSEGETLCGIAEPAGGWSLSGFTSTRDRIGCDSCRALAEEVIAAHFALRRQAGGADGRGST